MSKSLLPKNIQKQLRLLCSIAYTRELNSHLGELESKFSEWKKGTIDCWELNDFIHQFHDGISRDLYKTYNYVDSKELLVSRALSLGFLEQSELPEGFLPPSLPFNFD